MVLFKIYYPTLTQFSLLAVGSLETSFISSSHSPLFQPRRPCCDVCKKNEATKSLGPQRRALLTERNAPDAICLARRICGSCSSTISKKWGRRGSRDRYLLSESANYNPTPIRMRRPRDVEKQEELISEAHARSEARSAAIREGRASQRKPYEALSLAQQRRRVTIVAAKVRAKILEVADKNGLSAGRLTLDILTGFYS